MRAARGRHLQQLCGDVENGGIAAVDQQLRSGPRRIDESPFEIRGHEHADGNLTPAHGLGQRLRLSRPGCRSAAPGWLPCPRSAAVTSWYPPGRRRPREVAYVQIDGVAEQQDLHQRDADHHADSKPVPAELARLFRGDGP